MARPSTTRPLIVYLVEGVDTDNNEIIGDLVPATSKRSALRKVAKARPYMTNLVAQSVKDHLWQAATLAATPLDHVQRDWDAFAAEAAEIYED